VATLVPVINVGLAVGEFVGVAVGVAVGESVGVHLYWLNSFLFSTAPTLMKVFLC